jgi:hypothetical protein
VDKGENQIFSFFLSFLSFRTYLENKYKPKYNPKRHFSQLYMTYVYINEDQIDIELKCTICDEPFQSPMNCNSCGNTYCQECIMTWMAQQSSCPSCRQIGNHFFPVISRVVLNQLNRLLVQCTLCQQTDIQRSNFKDHISCTCPKQIVNCTDNCGWKGCREDLQQHVINCRQNQLLGFQIPQSWKTIAFLALAILFYIVLKSGESKK